MFNWRDLKNPAGGGAEVYTHQIMQRLVARDHDVTVFTSAFRGSIPEEVIDGVRYVRDGGRFTVYPRARRFYRQSQERYDVVIDEINTVPFMTPKFVNRGEKVIALIHQLAREFWFFEMPYPAAWLGYHVLEDRWLKRYRDITTITVSDSTRNELLELGFTDISVVHNGLNVTPLDSIPSKSRVPSMAFVGRMKKAKKPDDVVKAYRMLKERHPKLQLTMIGDGYCREQLKAENPDIEFTGYISREKRDELVKQSWVIAVPGVREGWGQVVTDANALGTPAVGYDIPGLRDSIKNGKNGLLVRPDPASMARAIDALLSDELMRDSLTAGALTWSKSFDWDKSARWFEEIIMKP